ncbi:hypothetical protein [Teredinibacter sp. KSP-S5-2]|uniref:head-tail joining protein n=1 Tax=Teredinibacter sp. KSP-S5-2 TaxID=3034506 RepID=UPI002934A4B0|nr:hypothetical protein [Teredinibacter sp. KSP-S5-2]WNO10543.1 hypothetical protein P5V12_05090 [Teredinibacter sp. KSP-S5-2]
MPVPEQFSRMIDALFVRLGVEALWQRGDEEPVAILVIPKRPEKLFALGEAEIHGEEPVFDVRRWQVPDLQLGDVLTVDNVPYRIEAEPTLEKMHLVWVAQTLPLATI